MSEQLSYEKLMALIQAGSEAAQAEREAAQAEREAEREADRKAEHERSERSDREYERAQAEIQKFREDMREAGCRIDALFAETARRMEASSVETDRVVKEVSRQLGGIGNSNGAMAENYFYNSFNQTKKFGHETFDYADRNLKWRTRDLQDEYDIVLFNGQSIGIIEVKYDAEKKHVAQTINKATTFRQLFPMYKDFTFYLGLASFVFTEDVEKAALDAGIAVIKQVGDTVVIKGDQMKKF